MEKHRSRRIAVAVFLASTLISAHFFNTMEYNQVLAPPAAVFTGGTWTGASYRSPIKEATAPLDIRKIYLLLPDNIYWTTRFSDTAERDTDF